MKSLHLKSGRDKSLKRRHPWIFTGAVAKVDGEPASGETVLVKSGGQPVAVDPQAHGVAPLAADDHRGHAGQRFHPVGDVAVGVVR